MCCLALPVVSRVVRAVPAVLVALLTLAGCAQFPQTGPLDWQPKPDLGVEAAPRPELPGTALPGSPGSPGRPARPSPSGAAAAPQGCADPDPQVVATCLAPISAVAVLPGGQAALVAERSTGRVLRVEKDKPPVVVATLPVDPTGGGGLTGLALSPSYDEDELIYVYVTTPTDNRVVRLAVGDVPKPVLSGIPRGATGNAGALGAGADGALLVATGDAGDAAAPAAPGSLAGKVLRVDEFGRPLPTNPDPASPVFTSGLHTPGGLCTDPGTGTTWVTDRAGMRDVLYRVAPGAVATPAWAWPDRPAVAGCAVSPGMLAVALTGASGLFVLHLTPEGVFAGTPQTVLSGTYGRLSAAATGPDGLIWLGTTNKSGGGPVVSSDDRVVRIQPPSGGGSGVD